MHDRNFGYSQNTQNLIGAVIHTEHPLQEIREFVLFAPKLLVQAHQTLKKGNQLAEFFKRLANNAYTPCLEGRLAEIQEYMVTIAANKEALELRLAPPLISEWTKKKIIKKFR